MEPALPTVKELGEMGSSLTEQSEQPQPSQALEEIF